MPELPDLDAATLGELFYLRRLGASYALLAMVLNRRAVKGARGGRWYGASVRLHLGHLTALASESETQGCTRTLAAGWPGICRDVRDAPPARLPEPSSSLASPLP